MASGDKNCSGWLSEYGLKLFVFELYPIKILLRKTSKVGDEE
jgi:hypothetical protein